MKTLTDDQAELLRQLRPKVRPALDAVSDLINHLIRACPHRDYNHASCWICTLYLALTRTEAELRDVPDDLDKALLDGPDPNRKGRRP